MVWWRRFYRSFSRQRYISSLRFGPTATALLGVTTIAARAAIPIRTDSNDIKSFPTVVPDCKEHELMMDSTEAIRKLSLQVAQLRGETDSTETNNSRLWPTFSWRSINREGLIEMWWNLPNGLDTSEIVSSMMDKLGGEMKISMVDMESDYSHSTPLLPSTPSSGSMLFSDASDSMHFIVQRPGSSSRVPARIIVRKYGTWSERDVLAITQTYKISAQKVVESHSKLEKLGVRVFCPQDGLSWEDLGGYEDLKKTIKSNIILALERPQIYTDITAITRQKPCTNRPKAVLFEGEPGTGKTTCARIIAHSCDAPLVIIPLESVMSKYYGESEKILAQIFDHIDDLGDAIIFIDEIDSIAPSRGGEIHEASRRILSVLLQRIEGIDGQRPSILIGATNRKQDLDAALLSRFDTVIRFPEPTSIERAEIFKLYAKHLNEEEREQLAKQTQGMSGRDIKDLCGQAERAWAAELVKTKKSVSGPPIAHYEDAVKARVNAVSRLRSTVRTLPALSSLI